MKTYFAIIGTSRNACGGVRYSLTAYNSESHIIEYAQDECARTGESLDESDEFNSAIEKLNDDGRRYSIYENTPEGIEEFLNDADAIGQLERAEELVA